MEKELHSIVLSDFRGNVGNGADMKRYIWRRVWQSLIVIFGVTIVAFGCEFLTGDPTTLVLGDTRGMSEEAVNAFRTQMGFDRPWLVQYADYISGIFRGDFGTSYYFNRPCLEMVMEAFPYTVILALSALCLTLIISLPLGIASAVKRNSLIDRVGMVFGLLGQSLPVFWLGLLLIIVFGVELQVLPVSGAGDFTHLILPTITLGLFGCARNARLVRSEMLEVMEQDYIRTARSKGLSEKLVIFKHGLRNALGTVITMIGLEFGGLLGGSVITESIFSWPGIGRLAYQALTRKDIPLVQCCVILCATIYVVMNLAVDLLYLVVDPKAKLK